MSLLRNVGSRNFLFPMLNVNDIFSLDAFSLDSEEFIRIKTKYTGKNQLAFAVMLKFFQIEGRYPSYKNSIPDRLISCLPTQLNLRQQSLDNFNWNSITAKRFRQEIRELLGYKKATVADGQRLIEWLMDKILQQAPSLPRHRCENLIRVNKCYNMYLLQHSCQSK
ncbi:hypothetical protein BH10PSE19_BH10PSE19_18930 [soil metagenome]